MNILYRILLLNYHINIHMQLIGVLILRESRNYIFIRY